MEHTENRSRSSSAFPPWVSTDSRSTTITHPRPAQNVRRHNFLLVWMLLMSFGERRNLVSQRRQLGRPEHESGNNFVTDFVILVCRRYTSRFASLGELLPPAIHRSV